MNQSITAVARRFPELRTERLFLRRITKRDRSSIFEIFSDDETLRYYDIDPFQKKQEADELIAFFAERERRGVGIRWAIALPGRGESSASSTSKNSKLIGTCGFNRFERSEARRGIVGYDLAKEYWGRGYVPEAMQAVVRYGFENLELNRIEAYVEPGNRASVRVLEKLGFTCEGLLRQFAFYRRAVRDQLCFSLLSSEWNSMNQAGEEN